MCDDSLTKRLWRKLVNEREVVGRRGRENGGRQGENGRLTMREATLACPNSCNDNAKGPGRASRRGSLRSPFGPFKRVAGMGRVVKKNQVAE